MTRKRRPFEEIVSLRSRSVDPRTDPQATTKISREELDAVIRRASGVRPKVDTSAHEAPAPAAAAPPADAFPGPRPSMVFEEAFGPREDDADAPPSAPVVTARSTPTPTPTPHEAIEPERISQAVPASTSAPDVTTGAPLDADATTSLLAHLRSPWILAVLAAVVVVASFAGYLLGRLGR